MIDKNSLGERLNNFKNKQQILEDTNIDANIDANIDKNNETPLSSVIYSIAKKFIVVYTFMTFLLKSLVFGYSLKILINTNWQFWEIVCVGVFINYIMIYIENLFHKDY